MKNYQILSAVLSKWSQPLVSAFAAQGMQQLPMVQALQNKVRSTGWVSPQWTLVAELGGMLEGVTAALVQPVLSRYLSQLDDESIPMMAHSIVDKAMEQGQLTLFEGNVTFDSEDLKRLKRLLEANLPIKSEESYQGKDSVQEND